MIIFPVLIFRRTTDSGRRTSPSGAGGAASLLGSKAAALGAYVTVITNTST
jgi:hypothetical protein